MTLRIKGTELYVTRCGSTEDGTHGKRIPTLVLHGGLGWDHTYLRPWFDPFADVLDLVYYDHRGNGRSARPAAWNDVTHETWAQDADALRAELGFERVLLIGHSYGSFLALEYAVRHPERLLGLVLCGSAPVLDYFETAVAKARAHATNAQFKALMNAMGAAPPRTDDEMRAVMDVVLPVYLHDGHAPPVPPLLQEIVYGRDAFVHAMTRCLPHYDVRAGLHQITAPTFIASGVDDWITPPTQGGARLHQGIPDAEHVVFTASGHFPFAEEPETFQSTLREWLRRQDVADNCEQAVGDGG